ncbi:MAG: hypothetical protein Q9225_007443 [Loekoesia sp. 1 TL-2023]
MESINTIARDSAGTNEQLARPTTIIGHSGEASDAPQSDHETLYTWPDGRTERAIRHEQIRSQLFQEAEAAWSWIRPQPHGTATDDRTAPVPYPLDQLTWGFEDRSQYPPINFVLERRGYKHPDYEVLPWYYNGLLVLDLDNKPLKNFHHLPFTISSKIPGGHVEALMRFDDRTTYADIRARMPPKILSYRSGKPYERPLKKIGALKVAAARYREMAGCLNWHDRMGSEVLNDYILANLPEELKAMNTTRGWRNLSKDEITALRAPAIGSRPHQARKRASSTEAREKREESIKKRRTKANAARVDFGGGRSPDQDCRTKIPVGNEEIEALQTALSPTMMQSISILGVEPVKYDLLSYENQLDDLQFQVSDMYRSLNRGNEDQPTLVQLTSWTGGIKNWRSARFWDGQTLYEINEEGGVGAKILNMSNTQQAVEEMQEDAPAQADGPPAEIAPSEEDTLKAAAVDEAQSEYTSDDCNSDHEPSVGSYLVDARGNRIHPNSGSATPLATSGIHEDNQEEVLSSLGNKPSLYKPNDAFESNEVADQEK